MSIEDKGGELRDGSLIEEQIVVETQNQEITEAETEQGRADADDSVSSHDTHDILDVSSLTLIIYGNVNDFNRTVLCITSLNGYYLIYQITQVHYLNQIKEYATSISLKNLKIVYSTAEMYK